MKTFGLFILVWLGIMLVLFNVWEAPSQEETLKIIWATQLAYIMYRLIKEEMK